MRQMQSRNPQAAAANPQMQTMQKVMPIFFAYIYFLIPAAVVIYMITSTLTDRDTGHHVPNRHRATGGRALHTGAQL